MLKFELAWVLLILPVPLLVYYLTPRFKEQSDAVRVPFFKVWSQVTPDKPSQGSVVRLKNIWQKLHLLLSWCLLIIALSKPVWISEPIVKEIKARDLLLVVDLSASMEERDFTNSQGDKASRLEAVKQVLAGFIKKREGDRIGLAVFGSLAFPQASFTDDLETISSLVYELQPNMAGPKTMIGDAIGLAVRLFESSQKQYKVAILLTDGNDSGSQMPVYKAAQIAKEKGIVFHTVAIGSPETTGEKALDVEILQTISKKTEGAFFLALDTLQLNHIYKELDRMEPELIDSISYRPTQDYFYLPIVTLLIMNLGFVFGLLFNHSREYQKVPNE